MIISENKKAVSWRISKLIIILYIVMGNIWFISVGGLFMMKPSEIISIPIVIIYIVKNLRIKLKRHEGQILIWLAIAVFSSCVGLVVYDYHLKDFLKGMFYPIRIVLVLFVVKYIHDAMKNNKIDREVLIRFVLNCYVAVCLIGFFQRAFFPEAYSWYNIFWSLGSAETPVDPHIRRLLSTYYDPNYLSVCLLIPFTIALHEWQKGKRQMLVYTGIYGIAIVLTVSRSGFLGMAIICLLAFVKTNVPRSMQWKNLLLIMCLLTAMGILLIGNAKVIERIQKSASDASTGARFQSWDYAFSLIKVNPVIGFGYNMFDAVSNVLYPSTGALSDGSDSSILLIMISTGALGLLYFLGSVAYDIYIAVKNRTFRYRRDLADVFAAAMIVSNFNNVLFYVLWMFPMLLVFGQEEEERVPSNTLFFKMKSNHIGDERILHTTT